MESDECGPTTEKDCSASPMETDDGASAVNIENQDDNMHDCCLWSDLGTCNSKICSSKTIHGMRSLARCRIDQKGWSKLSIPIAILNSSVMSYLRNHGVISRHNEPLIPILERDLVLNRLQRIVSIDNPDIKICPCHRYSYGIGWRLKNVCQHEDHRNEFGDGKFTDRPTQSSVSASRVACFNQVQRLAGFPYGGKLCCSHRLQLSKQDLFSVGQETKSDGKGTSGVQSFALWDHEPSDSANSILSRLQQSPIITKTTTLLQDQTPGAVRRLTAKLRRAVAAATTTIANSIAPGQGESLVNLAGLETVLSNQCSSHMKHNSKIDESFFDHLVHMYRAYESRNLPYNEKIRLLALIPDTWDVSYEDIQARFQCTKHAIKTARALRTATETPLHMDTRE